MTIRILMLLTALALPVATSAGTGDPPARVTQAVTITGAVRHPLTLGPDDLRAFETHSLTETPLVCQSGASLGKLRGYTGVRLRDLLEKAVIDAPGHNDAKKMVVIAGASDGYKVVYSLNEIVNSPVGEGVLVLFGKDGLPLGDDEGRLAMISAKDIRTGPRHVKWLESIEVRRIVE